MAVITAGIASSHVPAIGAAIDLGKTTEPYWKPLFDGYGWTREWLSKQTPDVVILVYNDHASSFSMELIPTFALGCADRFDIADEGFGARPVPQVEGHPALACHLAQNLILDEFDLTIMNRMSVDHGLTVPLSLMLGQPSRWPVRVIPLAVNVLQFPPPTGNRCFALGEAIARAVHSYPEHLKVQIWGTGGMSHQLGGARVGLINKPFDEAFLDRLTSDPEALRRIKHLEYVREAGTEGIELVMWLVMRGALGKDVIERYRLEGCHRALSVLSRTCVQHGGGPLGIGMFRKQILVNVSVIHVILRRISFVGNKARFPLNNPNDISLVRRRAIAALGAVAAVPAMASLARPKTSMSPADVDTYLTGQGAHRVSIPEWAFKTASQQRGHWEQTDPLNVPRCALLVVDMQNAFVAPGNPSSVPGAQRIIPNINELAHAVRTQAGLVVWLRMASVPGDWSALYDSFLPNVRDSVRDLLRPGSVGHQLHDQMKVHSEDVVLDKTRFSAFIGSSSTLDHLLRQRNIDTLLVTGTLSNVCCESTARDGMMLNYQVIFVSDANAAPNDELHNATLVNIIRVFGTVSPTSTILGRIRSS